MGDEHYMRSQKLEKVGDGDLSAMVFVGDLGNWQSGRWIIILRATGIVDTLPISHITHHSHEPACEALSPFDIYPLAEDLIKFCLVIHASAASVFKLVQDHHDCSVFPNLQQKTPTKSWFQL